MPNFPSTLGRIFHLLLLTLSLSCLCRGHVLQQRIDENELATEILQNLAEYEGVNSQELEQLPDFVPEAVESVDSLVGFPQIGSQISGRKEIQPAPFTLNMHVLEDMNNLAQDLAYSFNNVGGDSIIFGLVASNGLWVLTMNNDYALSVNNPKAQNPPSASRLRMSSRFKISIVRTLLGIPQRRSTKPPPQTPATEPHPQNLHDFAEQVVRQGGWMQELVAIEEIYKPKGGPTNAVHQSLITATGTEILAYLKSGFDQKGVKFSRVPWRRSDDPSTSSDTQFGIILFHSDGGAAIGEPGWKGLAYYGSELGAFVDIGDAPNGDPQDDPQDECVQIDNKWPREELKELWNKATKFTPSSPSTPLAELVLWPGDDTPGHQAIQGYANNLGSVNGIVILVLTTKGYWALMIPGKFIRENKLRWLASSPDKDNYPGILRLRSRYLGEQIRGQPETTVAMNLVRAVQILSEKGASLWDIIILAPTSNKRADGRISNAALVDTILARVKELTKSLYPLDEQGVQKASWIRSPSLRASMYNYLMIQSLYQVDLGGRLAGQKGALVQIFYDERLQLRIALEENGAGFEVDVFEMSQFTIGNAIAT